MTRTTLAVLVAVVTLAGFAIFAVADPLLKFGIILVAVLGGWLAADHFRKPRRGGW